MYVYTMQSCRSEYITGTLPKQTPSVLESLDQSRAGLSLISSHLISPSRSRRVRTRFLTSMCIAGTMQVELADTRWDRRPLNDSTILSLALQSKRNTASISSLYSSGLHTIITTIATASSSQSPPPPPPQINSPQNQQSEVKANPKRRMKCQGSIWKTSNSKI